jgi:hypothetical protein
VRKGDLNGGAAVIRKSLETKLRRAKGAKAQLKNFLCTFSSVAVVKKTAPLQAANTHGRSTGRACRSDKVIRWDCAARDSILLLSTILVGCNTYPPDVASLKFDGTYVGTAQLTTRVGSFGDVLYCQVLRPPRMVVTDGWLEFVQARQQNALYVNVASFRIAVHDDGSFRGSTLNRANNQPQILEGKVVGDSIEANTKNLYCQYHLTLKRD